MQLNDSEIHSTKCSKVDQATRVASFEETQFKIKLNSVRPLQKVKSSTHVKDIDVKTKASPTTSQGSAPDELTCVIKLYAESQQRQKLIGLLSFSVDHLKFEGVSMTAIPFKKCVDSSAVVVISTLIKGLEPAQKL